MMSIPVLPTVVALFALSVGFWLGVKATKRALKSMAYEKLEKDEQREFIRLLEIVLEKR